jgi:alkylation response protein AidB-like acyl-CoA dehydrogenase
MEYGDSPDEHEFRLRLRAWLRDNNPHVTYATDAYWNAYPEWHRSLYQAGFFGVTWPVEYGGGGLPAVYNVIVDQELAEAEAPSRPSVGYLVTGIMSHGSTEAKARFLPKLISGEDRWCQGFSEPDSGSDLASLRTTAERDGDEYVIHGHKVWTSYSDVANWCFLLARTELEGKKHKGLSVFGVRMDQPGVEQRPLKMINGVTREFGEVIFDGARVPVENMIGEPGQGWPLAMTIVTHEREPHELGWAARYSKTVNQLKAKARGGATDGDREAQQALAWGIVDAEMLEAHVVRRLSDRLDGMTHGPEGSIDKMLMTRTEESVGRAALAVGKVPHGTGDPMLFNTYLYSRAAAVMGGTEQIQKNLIATRILGLPT